MDVADGGLLRIHRRLPDGHGDLGALQPGRRTPAGEEYAVEPQSYARATARVDNGSLTFLLDNLVDRIYPSDFRAQDATTPLLGTSRAFRVFLTMYLLD